MTFEAVLQGLPRLTFAQRQMLIGRAIELDEALADGADSEAAEKRLRELRKNPALAVSLEKMEARVRRRFEK